MKPIPGLGRWDLRRLSASIWVAGRQNSVSEELCGQAVHCCVAAYRLRDTPPRRTAAVLSLFRSIGCRPSLAAQTAGSLKAEVARSARRARQRTSDRALPRFTREVDGVRRIIEEPPLITRLPEREDEPARRSPRRAVYVREVAGSFADSVDIPYDWRCCAFAGDRGLLTPSYRVRDLPGNRQALTSSGCSSSSIHQTRCPIRRCRLLRVRLVL